MSDTAIYPNGFDWHKFTRAVALLEYPPEWLTSALSDSSTWRLRVHVSKKTITSDYLDFLREQIELEPRGSEWTVRLERRLDALAVFSGREVDQYWVCLDRNCLSIRIDIDSGQLILSEEF